MKRRRQTAQSQRAQRELSDEDAASPEALCHSNALPWVEGDVCSELPRPLEPLLDFGEGNWATPRDRPTSNRSRTTLTPEYGCRTSARHAGQLQTFPSP